MSSLEDFVSATAGPDPEKFKGEGGGGGGGGGNFKSHTQFTKLGVALKEKNFVECCGFHHNEHYLEKKAFAQRQEVHAIKMGGSNEHPHTM